MSTQRQDLVRSAVNFLRDPKVQGSPLQKRVAFLESKRLTEEEIEEALRQAKEGVPSQQQQQAMMLPAGQQPVIYAQQPPAVPRMDWRDYFVAAMLIGGIGYAIVAVIKKYVTPLLRTPTAADLERDKKAISEQYSAAADRLDDVRTDTQFVRKQVEEQAASVRESLAALGSTLDELRDHDSKRDIDVSSLREQVDAIRDMIPKFLEKTKETQAQRLDDLQQELKSLKSLLLNRRPMAPFGTVGDVPTSNDTSSTQPLSPTISTAFSNAAGARIPNWQLGRDNDSGTGKSDGSGTGGSESIDGAQSGAS